MRRVGRAWPAPRGRWAGPMKIVYVAAKYDYGIQERGLSFEHYSFYDTLVAMGHEVEYFDFLSVFRRFGRERMSRMLREVVDSVRPDLMFTFLYTDEFDPRVLRAITDETGTVTFNWFADDQWRFDGFSRHWAPCFSFVSTTDPSSVPRYKASGYDRVLLTQWAANPRICARRSTPPRYEAAFVGQAYGDRPAVIAALRRAGIDVRTWGASWRLRRWHTLARRCRLMSGRRYERIVDSTRLTQAEMVGVINASRINVNLSSAWRGQQNQIKGRNFEIPACGGFQLSGHADGIEEWFAPGKEIVCYRSTAELIELARYYLDHEPERAAIADAGYRRVMRDHTYEIRLRDLFRQMHLA
jgi:spore maturation protein CgeB